MAYSVGRAGAAWWRLAARVRAQVAEYGTPCHLCGQPIDLTLHRYHSRSFTVDHLIALADNGAPLDPANVAPAHRSCNTAKNNKARAMKRRIHRAKSVSTSRQW
jgi:5-methylcytosine-specific restriction endonuclease McrA